MRTGVAFVLLYFVFDRLAAALGKTRGEAGLVVGSVVIALAGVKVLVDDAAAFQNLAIAWVALGLTAPWLFFLSRHFSARAAASTLHRP